jgi:hypothetical protein
MNFALVSLIAPKFARCPEWVDAVEKGLEIILEL